MTNQHTMLGVLALLFAAGAGCATDEAQPSTPRDTKIAEQHAAHMERGKQLFAELDVDKSGSLSAAEVADVQGPAMMLKMHFAEIDANRDGQLTHDELRGAMQAHHAERDAHHAEVLERFDADGDGELSTEERAAAHRFYFDQADADDSGSLTAAELRTAPGPGPLMAEHLAEIDGNGDGALSYDEITAAIEAHHRHQP
jgi:Ca2+-binding EF-hand superfamily protein